MLRVASGGPERVETHEYRKIHRAGAGLHPVRADLCARPGASAVPARASSESAARRPRGHGGRADRARRRAARRKRSSRRKSALAKLPKVSGGTGQLYLSQPLARVFTTAEQIAEKAGDSYVTVERLLLALAMEKDAATAKILADAGVTPTALNQAINAHPPGPHRRHRLGRVRLRRAEEIRARPDRGGARRQARSGHRPRRGNPPHHPGALAPHQEQSRADRRAGRRQDRHRRRPGAAHRQRRRAGEPEGQEADGARHGRADRRREVSRRVRGAAEGRALRDHRRRAARSSSSSTRCICWSAPARRKARWTPRTC